MSVSFNQPSQYPVSALNVKSAQKPDEAAKASFKGAPEGEEKEGMSTAAKVGIGAAVLGTAAAILYFTCGKGGSKAAEGAKDVAEKAKEALVDTKKYFDTSIDDFKKAGNTFKNGKAVTPDGKNFEGTVGRLTGKTENGVDCYSKSTYKNGVRETLERYEGDKLVSSVKYEYDQATGKVAKIIETDAATGNQVNKAFEYDQYGNMSKILKTDKDGKNLGRTEFDICNGRISERRDYDNGEKLLNKYVIDNNQFKQTFKDGEVVPESEEVMYSMRKLFDDGCLSKEFEISGFRKGKEVKAYRNDMLNNVRTAIGKDGSKNLMVIRKHPNGEKELASIELSSPVKGMMDVKSLKYMVDPNAVEVSKLGNYRLEKQNGNGVFYDTSKGGKTEIASMENGKIFKDGAEVDTANLKAKIGDTEITSDNLDSYTIGTEKYKYDNSGVTKVLVDEKGAPVTDQAVIDKINQFDKHFEWFNLLL